MNIASTAGVSSRAAIDLERAAEGFDTGVRSCGTAFAVSTDHCGTGRCGTDRRARAAGGRLDR
jgi:uncharacterized low-complexity protein